MLNTPINNLKDICFGNSLSMTRNLKMGKKSFKFSYAASGWKAFIQEGYLFSPIKEYKMKNFSLDYHGFVAGVEGKVTFYSNW